MSECTMSRVDRSGRLVFRLAGVFDRTASWELCEEILAEAEREILLDFTLVRDVSDLALALLAQGIGGSGRRLLFQGLQQTQLRTLRYGDRVEERTARDGRCRPFLPRPLNSDGLVAERATRLERAARVAQLGRDAGGSIKGRAFGRRPGQPWRQGRPGRSLYGRRWTWVCAGGSSRPSTRGGVAARGGARPAGIGNWVGGEHVVAGYGLARPGEIFPGQTRRRRGAAPPAEDSLLERLAALHERKAAGQAAERPTVASVPRLVNTAGARCRSLPGPGARTGGPPGAAP